MLLLNIPNCVDEGRGVLLCACRKECVAKDVVKKGCSESSFAISRCRQDLLQEAREEAREEVREEAREEVMEPEVGAKVLQLTSDLQEHLFISDEICRCLEAVASEDLPQVTKEAFEVGSSNQHSEQHDYNNLSYN